MNTYLGSSEFLGPEDVDGDLIAAAQVTYLEGYLFDRPEAQEAYWKASRIAHDAGRRVSLTLSDTFCVERHKEAWRSLVTDQVDILFANEGEAMALYDVDSLDAAIEHVRPTSRSPRSPAGRKGSLVVHAGEVIEVAAHPADRWSTPPAPATSTPPASSSATPPAAARRLWAPRLDGCHRGAGPHRAPARPLPRPAGLGLRAVTDADPWALVERRGGRHRRAHGVERHDVLVVLGSGWTPAADRFGDTTAEVPIAELPGFPAVGVAGHAGLLRSVEADGGRRILALLGRVHAYEGHDLSVVVHAVRAAVRAGAAPSSSPTRRAGSGPGCTWASRC